MDNNGKVKLTYNGFEFTAQSVAIKEDARSLLSLPLRRFVVYIAGSTNDKNGKAIRAE